MNTISKRKILSVDGSDLATAEQRLRQLGIKLPAPPEPFGIYAEAVQTGNLLFLTGMLPTEGREAKFIGRIGAELDAQTGRKAAYLAALNGLAAARQHLGSLDRVTQIVRLGVAVATSGDVRDQPRVADGASELLQDIFGKSKNPSRLVYGVASLPLGTPVEGSSRLCGNSMRDRSRILWTYSRSTAAFRELTQVFKDRSVSVS